MSKKSWLEDIGVDWDKNKDGWFPFATRGDEILFVDPDNIKNSYWTKNENYNEESNE